MSGDMHQGEHIHKRRGEWSHEELMNLSQLFAKTAGEAEAKAWQDLYLDASDALADVVSAEKGELDL